MKVNRPDLLSGHMKKTFKEQLEDAGVAIALSVLVVIIYVLFILG